MGGGGFANFVGPMTQGISGILLGIRGHLQEKKAAKELEKLKKERPIYSVDPGYSQNQAIYSRLTNTSQLPGQSQMENKLSQNTANTIGSAAMYGVNNPAVLSQLAQQALQAQNDSVNELNIAGAQQRNQNFANLAKTNIDMAEEKDKAWNYNVNEPYQNEVAEAREKRKEGRQMFYKGGDLGVSSAQQISS